MLELCIVLALERSASGRESRAVYYRYQSLLAHAPKLSRSQAAAASHTQPQDIVASFAVKPTSSILTSRDTIDKKGKNTKISVKGRHDPCVGIRAVPIGEAMINCVLLDHLLMHRAQCG